MRNQYNDSFPTLAFDTGSPLTSVALARHGRLLGCAEADGGRSSARLLALIEELLQRHGLRQGDLARVIAARGPGSFTGLRVGLATALGLHQALGVKATAIGTLPLLARAVATTDSRPVVAVVDALRGEWFAQAFADGGLGEPLSAAAIVTPATLLDPGPCRLTGFGLETLPDEVADHGDLEIVPATALAPTLLAFADDSQLEWDPAPLVEPLYLRPPAATPSRG